MFSFTRGLQVRCHLSHLHIVQTSASNVCNHLLAIFSSFPVQFLESLGRVESWAETGWRVVTNIKDCFSSLIWWCTRNCAYLFRWTRILQYTTTTIYATYLYHTFFERRFNTRLFGYRRQLKIPKGGHTSLRSPSPAFFSIQSKTSQSSWQDSKQVKMPVSFSNLY